MICKRNNPPKTFHRTPFAPSESAVDLRCRKKARRENEKTNSSAGTSPRNGPFSLAIMALVWLHNVSECLCIDQRRLESQLQLVRETQRFVRIQTSCRSLYVEPGTKSTHGVQLQDTRIPLLENHGVCLSAPMDSSLYLPTYLWKQSSKQAINEAMIQSAKRAIYREME